MEHIFMAFLLTSLIGTALAMILVLLRPVTKKIFPYSWHYYMWLIVLLVMVLPIKLNLPQTLVTTTPYVENVTFEDSNFQNVETYVVSETTPDKITQNESVNTEKVSAMQSFKDVLKGKTLMLSFIWVIGASVLFLIKLISYLIFLLKIHKYSKITDLIEVKAYTNKKVKTRVSNTICSPLMVGIFKPTLLLPETDITPKQLKNIMAHEMTHLKRNDILYKWFVSIVKCVHWFNPAIYFISKQINIDCEISCDLKVVKQMDEEAKKGYVETILSLLSHNNSKAIPLTTGMTSDKKTLIRRFMMIKNRLNTNKKTVIISIVIAIVFLIGTVLASGLINGKLLNEYENQLIALNTDKRQQDNFNFLILGVDENNRADTIMVLSFKDGNITGTSIPRDTAFISKELDRKAKLSEILNSENGNQKVIDAVRDTLSIPITYYAKVNLSAIKDIVDSVGGIEFDVPMDMEYDDPQKNLHIRLKQGEQILSGNDVCGLLQFRRSNNGIGYVDGDMSRIKTGQQFIKEFISQKINKDYIYKAPEIFKTIADNIETNYPISNLMNDIKLFEKTLSNIEFRTIDGTLIADDTGIVFYDINNGEVVSTVSEPHRIEKSAQVNKTTKIKSSEVADELYTGFEHLVLKNTDTNKIKTELNKQGMVETKNSTVDLTKNYIVKDYSSEQTKVVSDKNGNISMYFSVNSDNLFDVRFYDAKTGEDVAGYGVLANNENAYTFIGFEKGKAYNVEVQGKTKDDWVIEGNYIIY